MDDTTKISKGKVFIIKAGRYQINNESQIYTVPDELDDKIIMTIRKIGKKKILGLIGNQKLEIPIIALKELETRNL